MYKVVLYGLLLLAVIVIIFAAFGLLPYHPLAYISSLLILGITCYVSNVLFSKILKAPTNSESYLITATILFFIFDPVTTPEAALPIFLASLIAMASKYVLAINKKHIFNPAAIATFIMGLLGNGSASWWVGSTVLLPIVLIIGFLIVRKIRRFRMVGTFLAAALITISFVQVFINSVPLQEALVSAFTSWPLIFFATVMLTEPMTTPPRNNLRIMYAIIVGLLFGAQFEFGPIFSTPELALVIGNIFSFIVSPKQRLTLILKEKRPLATGMHEFVFNADKKLPFLPGQYLEWTLPHKKADIRGNRRYFTIASSPTEQEIKLGVRIQEKGGSSFKRALQDMKAGDTMAASQLAGDFTLNTDANKKLVFIAGGIGVTPFRSMIQNLLDTKQKRDIVFLYTVPHPNELAYRDIFEKAGRDLGLRYYYVVTRPENAPKDWTGKTGRMDEAMVKEVAPDYKDRIFYLSGPNAMVETYKQLLYKLGVPWTNIRTDFFPGF
jgi:ferredoxin-NADP reductase